MKWMRAILWIVLLVVVLAAAYFGSRVFYYSNQLQTGVPIDLSSFAGVGTSSQLNQGDGSDASATDAAENDAWTNLNGEPTIGAEDPLVQIVAFEDFECPYCGRAFPILKSLVQEYGDTVQLVYKDFPLTSIHPDAQTAAEAAQCAHAQGQFWAYHDILYRNQSALSDSDLRGYARAIGLDANQFDSCLASGATTQEVNQDFSEGLAAGVLGTPTFFINGNRVQGVISQDGFEQIIEFIENQ